VHGGWVAALFDDVLGAAQWLVESRGVTARLTVQYRQVTPCEEELRFEAWIEERRGRRVRARATCHAGATLTAEAEALFLAVDFRRIDEHMRSLKDGRGDAPEDGDARSLPEEDGAD
jgi:acyl-coenzyme A thioesterase PaaI-like protein